MPVKSQEKFYFVNLFLSLSLGFGLVLGSQVSWAQRGDLNEYIQTLESPETEWTRRSQAIQDLGMIIRDDSTLAAEVINPLLDTLADENLVVRLRAVQVLSEIDVTLIPQLLAGLSSQNSAIRENTELVLTGMGTEAVPALINAWNQASKRDDKQLQASLTKVFATIAQNLKTKSESESAWDYDIAMLEADISDLEQIVLVMPPPNNPLLQGEGLSPEEIGKLSNTDQFNSDRQAFYTAYQSLQAELSRRQQEQITIWLVQGLGSFLLIIFLVLWFRPQLVLQISRALVQARTSRSESDHVLLEIQQFFNHTGATLQRKSSRALVLKTIPNRLKAYTPIPILLATDQPSEADVTELTQLAQRVNSQQKPKAGILLYRKSPDAIFRTEMAKVRMRDQFVLIPIPLAAIEQAVTNPTTASGILVQYSDRYLPGADLFDDRNAIGDTLSFFGRQEVLQRLEEELRRYQGIGLFGVRKSGKTSLLLQLGFALRHHPLVHLDLQPYGGKIRAGTDLFNYLTQDLLRLLREKSPKTKLQIEPFSSGTPASEVAAIFVQQVMELASALIQAGYDAPIIFFLDEVERILPIEGDAKERAEEFNAFFGALRSLNQEKRLISFLVADVHPDCNRINQWSQSGVATNPVFQFFKETFVTPLNKSETLQMLTDIGEFMGITFDAETKTALYKESGGYPFVARQLASLLFSKVAAENNGQVNYQNSQRYIIKSFTYSGVLKDYFSQNIWDDLEKRSFTAAIQILTLLTCNAEQQPIAESRLLEKLGANLNPSQVSDALLWLVSVGLINQHLLDEEKSDRLESRDAYELHVPLLGRWLKMNLNQEVQNQWQL